MKRILYLIVALVFIASSSFAQEVKSTTPELEMETVGEPKGPASSLPVDEPQSPATIAGTPPKGMAKTKLTLTPAAPSQPVAPLKDASMVSIKGSYGAAAGFQTDKFTWKNANGNYQEKNFRYIDQYEGINTYDQRIFDRYQLEIQTNTNTPWNAYCEIVVDPWSFVGTASETVFNAWGDSATVKYKYWEATGKTINEVYRTNAANSIATQETKVIGGKIDQQVIAPALWGSPAFTLSPNNSTEIDYKLMPVRKLWVTYDQEPLYIKIFPIADQAEALTSDDPMQLSNNHPYWAPSPWLYNYVHGIQFTNGSVFQSRWDNTLPAYAQDSSRNFLTFLRGVTISYKKSDLADFTTTIAAPMSLWDDFDYVDSVPIAARLRVHPNDDVLMGVTVTDKMGIFKNAVKANNIVGAVDGTYRLFGETFAFGELAGSYADYSYANDMRQGFNGIAYKAGMRSTNDLAHGNKFIWDASFTSMSKQFQPGLSDYRDTRVDRDWGRHILFDPFSEDDWNDRIGDSVDVNRLVIGGNCRIILFDSLFDIFVNVRNAHEEQTGKFIENIIRVEPTFNPHKRVQIKGLYLQRNYPNAQGDMDPILKERFTDLPWMNYGVTDGSKTAIYTYSGGAKVDIIPNKLAVYGIYEATNDPQDFPRGICNNVAFNTTVPADDTDDWLSNSNLMFDRLISQVYSQQIFGAQPAYDFYSIWKAKIGYSPIKNLRITYTHVTNQNKNYAALLDDNHDHDSVDVAYKPFDRVMLRAGWSVSRIIDIRRALDNVMSSPPSSYYDRAWEAHHNIYAQMEYDVNKKKAQKLIVQFGEYGLLSGDMGLFGGSVERRYVSSKAAVYDTRAIVRLFYMGKF
jgi:hypothetical protein